MSYLFQDPKFWLLISFITFIILMIKPFKSMMIGGLDSKIAEIKDVINTIYCDISISYAFQSNTIVVNSAIDNLLKGAASQAIQCLDIMSS